MITIIGWIGSALCVASLVQKNQLRFRALNLAACAAMVIFNTANATWSMVALNVVVAAINVRQIVAIRGAAGVAGAAVSEPPVPARPATPGTTPPRPARHLVAV